MERIELEERIAEYLSREDHPYFQSDLEKARESESLQELEDRFYRELEFGTGGLRGIIGAGYNRINPANIRRATQGLANYVRAMGVEPSSCVIAYDSRDFSRLFALEAGLVLVNNGFDSYVFSSPRPTPVLSYAVRLLNASIGIVITASHNPPEYNGYKVYWNDGGQLVPPHDRGIISEVRRVSGRVEIADEAEAVAAGRLHFVDSKVDDRYVEMVRSCLLRRELTKQRGGKLKAVYTPLHGTGAPLMERIFGDIGIPILIVPEQKEPDGKFPTVKSPNPEDSAALAMAVAMAKEEGAQLVLGTDPDSDRLGLAVPGQDGEFVPLTGNQIGTLLADYCFLTRLEAGTLPESPVLVKTIVTTQLQAEVAKKYGATCYDVLTGFKYIAEKIREFEDSGEGYVFGGEESYGYLATPMVRDKDAISTAALVAEMVCYYHSKGRSLLDRLDELWMEFGYFHEIQVAKTLKGETGERRIRKIMSHFREQPPEEVAGVVVEKIIDYQRASSSGLPKADVIQICLEDGTIITARPSGTEPKVKFYASLRNSPGEPLAQSRLKVEERASRVEEYIEGLLS